MSSPLKEYHGRSCFLCENMIDIRCDVHRNPHSLEIMNDVPEPYRQEMERVVETALNWWMERLVPRLEGEMQMMYKTRKESFGGNSSGWEKEFRRDLKDILCSVVNQMRGIHNYKRDPQAGSKKRRIGLPENFCPFSDELWSLLERFDIDPDETGWPQDGVMCLNPFLVYIRYRQEETSETIYKRPRVLDNQ